MSLSNFLQRVRQDGLVINTVYDIGANAGYWTAEMKQTVLSGSKFYMFEGNALHYNSLANVGSPFYICILSNPGRDTVDYYVANTTGDSYYKENTVHYDNASVVPMPCYTLDSIVAQDKLPIPDFIKIDTQGSELDILRGAESILDQAKLVYLECPIITYNLGAPNINDYLEYMKSKGFIPMDALEVHTSEQTLLQVDIMFINLKTKNELYGEYKFLTV